MKRSMLRRIVSSALFVLGSPLLVLGILAAWLTSMVRDAYSLTALGLSSEAFGPGRWCRFCFSPMVRLSDADCSGLRPYATFVCARAVEEPAALPEGSGCRYVWSEVVR